MPNKTGGPVIVWLLVISGIALLAAECAVTGAADVIGMNGWLSSCRAAVSMMLCIDGFAFVAAGILVRRAWLEKRGALVAVVTAMETARGLFGFVGGFTLSGVVALCWQIYATLACQRRLLSADMIVSEKIVRVTLVIATLLGACIGMLISVYVSRRLAQRLHGRCPNCGYCVSDMPRSICTECGYLLTKEA